MFSRVIYSLLGVVEVGELHLTLHSTQTIIEITQVVEEIFPKAASLRK